MIGIIGNGVVGSTLARWLTQHGDVRVYDIDPAKSPNTLDQIMDCDMVFICIYLPDNATGDGYKVLHDYVSMVPSGTTIVIKTTVTPGTCDLLQQSRKDVVILFNPEFLTEAHPYDDFRNPTIQVVGGPQTSAVEVLALLPTITHCRDFIVTTRQAEWLKLAIAGYLSTKVSWFNQLHDALGDDFEAVRHIMAAEPRIGGTHTNVSQDGYRGWGGKCFTKDTPCFAIRSMMSLMREVVKYNDALMRTRSK